MNNMQAEPARDQKNIIKNFKKAQIQQTFQNPENQASHHTLVIKSDQNIQSLKLQKVADDQLVDGQNQFNGEEVLNSNVVDNYSAQGNQRMAIKCKKKGWILFRVACFLFLIGIVFGMIVLVSQSMVQNNMDLIDNQDNSNKNTQNKQQSKKQQLQPLQPNQKPYTQLPSLPELPPPAQYFQFSKIQSKLMKELPFCIFILSKNSQRQLTHQSVIHQNYSKYAVFSDLQNFDGDIYQTYHKYIIKLCEVNSLILFLDGPITENALSNLNSMHQKYNTWVTYSYSPSTNKQSDEKKVQVFSFYYRVYSLIGLNDFNHDNYPFLKLFDSHVMALAILQLCQIYAKSVPEEVIGIDSSAFHISSLDKIPLRTPYTRLFKLSQNYKIDLQAEQTNFDKIKIIKRQPNFLMTPQKMQSAIQRLQIIYLPLSHSINKLQYIQFQKYNISQDPNSRQTRFCVTVLNNNNVQNDRYKNLLHSIKNQKYTNYHIVFIDDLSTDKSLELARIYANYIGIPKDRITFVKNLQRKYATYNIINAAFNFCGVDDVQLLLDGDDEIIGRYAFQIMNSAYIDNPNRWIVYSSYKNSYYGFGSSSPYRDKRYLHNAQGRRKSYHFIGPIRTWRVKLVTHIPLKYHTDQNGQWLNTDYDDAIQYPLAQLAGVDRIFYIPQILYEYNTGQNDDSSTQKRTNRKKTYQWILSLNPLPQLKNLEAAVKNTQIQQILTQDKNTTFTTFP